MHNPLELTRRPPPSVARGGIVQRRESVSVAPLTGDSYVLAAPFVASRERERFDAVFAAFEDMGGIAHGEEVGRLLEERQSGDYVWLAKAIANGEVLSVAWSNTRWIPLFQFDPQDLSVRKQVSSVLVELHGVYDQWEIGCWFIEPNGWLDARRPLDLLHLAPGRVAQAARADRFIAASC